MESETSADGRAPASSPSSSSSGRRGRGISSEHTRIHPSFLGYWRIPRPLTQYSSSAEAGATEGEYRIQIGGGGPPPQQTNSKATDGEYRIQIGGGGPPAQQTNSKMARNRVIEQNSDDRESSDHEPEMCSFVFAESKDAMARKRLIQLNSDDRESKEKILKKEMKGYRTVSWALLALVVTMGMFNFEKAEICLGSVFYHYVPA